MNNNMALQKQEYSLNSWTAMKEQASMLVKTGFLPPSIKTPEQAIAIMLTGKELGIGTMEALRGINVISGKPTVSPQTMLALARRSGELEDIKFQEEKTSCTVLIKRKGQTPYSVTFGQDEATQMGLSTKDNYVKQAQTMYRWRALAANLRITFPDVISGLYTPEELGAEVLVTGEGEMTVIEQPKTVTTKSNKVDRKLAEIIKTAQEQWPDKAEMTAEMQVIIKAKFNKKSAKELTDTEKDELLEFLQSSRQAEEAEFEKIGDEIPL